MKNKVEILAEALDRMVATSDGPEECMPTARRLVALIEAAPPEETKRVIVPSFVPTCVSEAPYLTTMPGHTMTSKLLENQPNWIPVRERLPQHLEWVWFYRAVAMGDVMRGQFISDERGCFCSGGHRYWHPTENVTHWMPSPTPAPPSPIRVIE